MPALIVFPHFIHYLVIVERKCPNLGKYSGEFLIERDFVYHPAALLFKRFYICSRLFKPGFKTLLEHYKILIERVFDVLDKDIFLIFKIIVQQAMVDVCLCGNIFYGCLIKGLFQHALVKGLQNLQPAFVANHLFGHACVPMLFGNCRETK